MSWTKKTESTRTLFYSVLVLTIAAIGLWFGAGTNTTQANTEKGAADNVAPEATFAADAASLGAIPDGTAVTPLAYGAPRDVTFTVTGMNSAVSSVAVAFSAAHTFVGDIEVTLIAPNGASHLLFAKTGATSSTSFGSGNDLSSANTYSFIDSSTTNWWTSANGTTTPIPTSSNRTVVAGGAGITNPPATTNMTADFANVTNANGTWTLRFRDGASTDTGSVNAANLTLTAAAVPTTQRPLFDFHGGGRTSYNFITTATSAGTGVITWNSLKNPPGPGPGYEIKRIPFGDGSLDFFTPADYTGDGITDYSVWRPDPNGVSDDNNYFYTQPNSLSPAAPAASSAFEFGAVTDSPTPDAPHDFDGDGKDDYVVTRDLGGQIQWWILRSATNTANSVVFGATASDIVLPADDFSGDGKSDLAIARTSGSCAGTGQCNLTWLIGDSITGGYLPGTGAVLGNFNTDYIVTGDYLGDSRADFAVWRGFGSSADGFWYILQNGGSGQLITKFGIPGTAAVRDTAVRGDYDGDGKDDIAIYRPSTREWWVRKTSDGTAFIQPNTGPAAGQAFLITNAIGVQ